MASTLTTAGITFSTRSPNPSAGARVMAVWAMADVGWSKAVMVASDVAPRSPAMARAEMVRRREWEGVCSFLRSLLGLI